MTVPSVIAFFWTGYGPLGLVREPTCFACGDPSTMAALDGRDRTTH
jgi:hypothetical protein